MKRRPVIALIALLLGCWLLPAAGCGGEGPAGDTAPPATGATTTGADERAALLAAQTVLENAEALQEEYYRMHGSYAASVAELKTVNPRINPMLEITGGDTSGYEMRATAADSGHTVLILRKHDGRVERLVAGDGSW